MAKKQPINKYKQVLVDREREPKEQPHHRRINLVIGDIVDPSRYNAAFCCKHKVVIPCKALDIEHDDKNPYYTKVLVETVDGKRWLGQNWLEWEGKRKIEPGISPSNTSKMKARIDTKAKTIAIEESVSMDDLLKFAKFVGGDDWKAWKVETNVKFEITSSPIVIREYGNPWPTPYWYCGSTPTLVADGGTLIGSGTCGVSNAGEALNNNNITFVDFQNN